MAKVYQKAFVLSCSNEDHDYWYHDLINTVIEVKENPGHGEKFVEKETGKQVTDEDIVLVGDDPCPKLIEILVCFQNDRGIK